MLNNNYFYFMGEKKYAYKEDIEKELKKKWWLFVLAILASIIFAFYYPPYLSEENFVITCFPLALLLLYLSNLTTKIIKEGRMRFWMRFAMHNDWIYLGEYDISDERGLMFNVGHSRATRNAIEKKKDGVVEKIFSYQFAIGHGYGEHVTTYYYTVFEFSSLGSFPHIYLNRIGNQYGIDWWGKKPLSLPSEFRRKFKLYAPEKYEIEALQIFTPDILAFLLDADFKYDVELIDQKMIFYVDGLVNGEDDLKSKMEKIESAYNRLFPMLSKMRLYAVGDKSAYIDPPSKFRIF